MGGFCCNSGIGAFITSRYAGTSNVMRLMLRKGPACRGNTSILRGTRYSRGKATVRCNWTLECHHNGLSRRRWSVAWCAACANCTEVSIET
ncbi:hypothetical protein PILCRDRAFT_498564 [Piloderma croceum F 1598]|uniref:Uncharacterized protein n=1 Tax=Piloderma croceum (strain F 1598) TaxID=765440 RepID=A0A0C3FPL6_PILCF|nr:hypothetical protein PILCRDRAFT_498564 [Piloderma croceum F 1598]